ERNNHCRLADMQFFIGLGIIPITENYVIPLVMILQSLLQIFLQQHILIIILIKLLYECSRDRIEMGDDNMVAGAFRQFPGGSCSGLRFKPGSIEKLDKSERQQYQQRNHTRKQHKHRKNSAEIAGKGNISKSQRRHHRKGPVKARYPAVLLAFVFHDEME